MTAFNFVRLSVEDGVGILQLDHPEKRNALGWELHNEIIAALDLWEEDDAVACVLIDPRAEPAPIRQGERDLSPGADDMAWGGRLL